MFSENIQNKLENKGFACVNIDGLVHKNLNNESLKDEILDIAINATAYDEKKDKTGVEIAKANVKCIPFVSQKTMYSLLDELSAEYEIVGTGIGLLKKSMPKATRDMSDNGWLCYLERLYVAPNCRGIGVGSEILEQLASFIDDLVAICPSHIVLIPGAFEIPLGDETRKAADERLIRFYKKNACKTMPKSNVMYKEYN